MASLTNFIHNLAGKKQPATPVKAQPSQYYPTPDAGIAKVQNLPHISTNLQPVQAIGGGYPGYQDYSAPSGYDGTSGYYGASSADPNNDPSVKNPLIQDLQAKWSTLQNVFNGLFGKVDQYAQDATKRITDAYDTQQGQDINNFNKSQGLTSSMYAAKGIGDSSYLQDAQNQNSQDFNSALAQGGINRENQLAQIGQQVSGQKAQLTAQRDAYAPYINNLGQYGVSDLQGLQGNLQQALGNANTTGASLGTNSDFINSLNSVTPLESQASAQLASKLKNLTLSSAPSAAKKYVALGLIKANTLNDQNAQNYWNSYFQQLLDGTA